MSVLRFIPFLLVFVLSLDACQFGKKPVFSLVSSSKSKLTFANTITETDSFNVLNFEYIYNGGGVGIGDVNNDGLQDIFFTGNMVSSRLYLNKGDLTFEDITIPANVGTTAWCTGVAMVDINQDGRLDIYVCTVHPDKKKSAANLLYINQGNNESGVPVFKEEAQKAGLADTSYSTQAAFFDYDLDGDLDMYLVNNGLEDYNRNVAVGQKTNGTGRSLDKLYRNDGLQPSGLSRFTDVSRQAGINTEGWGLGVVTNDINRDGYPDLYITNDFLSNDLMYINNGDGTFTNKISKALKHQEQNGMGVDMADLNNDGLNDIVAVDMLPDDNLRQKTMFSDINYDQFQTVINRNYQPQYVRNTLQLNNGATGQGLPTFSDVGQLAGIAATDWSWSPLLADFDNDGNRDILITNGYSKDVTDLDFSVYSKDASMFGTKEAKLRNITKATNELAPIDKPDFLFQNKGNLVFTNVAAEWGITERAVSNGAAYADLDNDGDLDLVMNSIDSEALLYENHIQDTDAKTKPNYLRLKLVGPKGNPEGVGAKVTIWYKGGQQQYAEQVVQRSYTSTVEPFIHFGLGSQSAIDSLLIVWPGQKEERRKGEKANQTLKLYEQKARSGAASPAGAGLPNGQELPLLFSVAPANTTPPYKQTELDFVDFKTTSVLPRKFSQSGPGIAVGDVNGDGLDDFIISGSAGKPATMFLQRPDQTFSIGNLPAKESEDMGLLLFDADNDGDLDLYCVSGSSEFGSDEKAYQSRLYRNTGKGTYQLDGSALPPISASGSCVVASDFDKDGDLDLFIGGRLVPGKYPTAPASYLLRNDGKGHFSDVTDQLAPNLRRPGMITSALWTDYDNDGWVDLLVVGEFMPITFYKNSQGKTLGQQSVVLPNSVGWWNSVVGGDFDNDGDIDYVAGNLGLNSRYKASPDQPVCVYAKDFDDNGRIDPILCRFIQGKEYITHPRETLTTQIVSMRRRFLQYSDYGNATFSDVFNAEQLSGALILKATNMASSYIQNNGSGQFTIRPLPVEAQFSPLLGMLVSDVNGDGNLDLLGVGNEYSTEPLTGWYDAGIGTCLLGNGAGQLAALPVSKSGFLVDKDAKALAELRLASGRPLYIATQNQDSLRLLTTGGKKAEATVRLRPGDVYALTKLPGGKTRKTEFYWGSGYLSQSSSVMILPVNRQSGYVADSKGGKRPF
ncbi:VCBS repeat-containing protein [Fibrella aquatica]|uniref:VCBS repeat-containing protein n=1 Tax=Fibrella aquatica TaxID=3242487 RepID=UPI0035210E36